MRLGVPLGGTVTGAGCVPGGWTTADLAGAVALLGVAVGTDGRIQGEDRGGEGSGGRGGPSRGAGGRVPSRSAGDPRPGPRPSRTPSRTFKSRWSHYWTRFWRRTGQEVVLEPPALWDGALQLASECWPVMLP